MTEDQIDKLATRLMARVQEDQAIHKSSLMDEIRTSTVQLSLHPEREVFARLYAVAEQVKAETRARESKQIADANEKYAKAQLYQDMANRVNRMIERDREREQRQSDQHR